MEAISKDQPVPGPSIHSFNCPGCGGAVQVRAFGQSISVVCQFCGSVLDPSDKNVKILQKAEAALTRKPLIPIGRRGVMEGHEWEVIGFMVRSVPKWEFEWEEYLLFNPWYGYRFLVQSDGHWSWVKTINEIPDTKKMESQELRSHGKTFKLFSRGETARVEYVLGEFFWRVNRGDTVTVSDFIAPPHILSVEKDKSGIVWSKGEYLDSKELQKKFGTDIQLPPKRGIAPNQPDTFKAALKQSGIAFLVFAAILTLAQLYFWGTAANRSLGGKAVWIADSATNIRELIFEFKVPDKTANLNLVFDTYLINNWYTMEGNLHEKNTGLNYPFQYTSEYYQGYEDGEYWSEGKQDQEVFLNRVPPGDYELNLEMETEAGNKPPSFDLFIIQDVPLVSNYLIFISIMFVPVLVLLFLNRSYETRRWRDSEFDPFHINEGSDSGGESNFDSFPNF